MYQFKHCNLTLYSCHPKPTLVSTPSYDLFKMSTQSYPGQPICYTHVTATLELTGATATYSQEGGRMYL